MAQKVKTLKKELGLGSVYALATGATLSSGFFLLPGLAFESAGPAIVLCYLLAMVPLVPAMFCVVELSTAMPRAGGAYYFLDRSMGPLVGTIGGIGTWIALMLKAAFALIGMGAYVNLYFPSLEIVPVAAVLAVAFGVANLFGAKKIGSLQVILVAGLLAILAWFTASGIGRIDGTHLTNFMGAGVDAIIGTAGLVYISYVGITKVASVAEEVKDPERNLPRGIFLGVLTAGLVYGVGTLIMVGVVPADRLAGDLRPVATAAEILGGPWGRGFVTIAALFAFFAVVNAGILSASRYPFAMSRDHLLPGVFRKYNRHRMPVNGILTTLGVVLFIIFFLDPLKIAKLASAFQLLLFAFLCFAVIVMRESGLDSYDPGYRAPLYPWLQLFGMAVPCVMIFEMGMMPIIFSLGLLVLGALWYFQYARSRVIRHGAVYHVLERLGRRRDEGLDRELRGILKEKGLREQDPFDEVVVHAFVLDIAEPTSFEQVTRRSARLIAERLGKEADQLAEGFLQGTRVGATPVAHGAALPHIRLGGLNRSEMVIVRASAGFHIDVQDPLHHHASDRPVFAVFFLVSSDEDAAQHLRILAQIAKRVDDDAFVSRWLAATDDHDLKEILLRDDRFVSLILGPEHGTAGFIGRAVKDAGLPPSCLIVLVRRHGETIVPGGDMILRRGDRLTVIGSPKSIAQLYDRYLDLPTEET
jgi:amino acid transporter/mannitol/fructose-specific phosphotransferase system IIA component (Ntr-type)